MCPAVTSSAGTNMCAYYTIFGVLMPKNAHPLRVYCSREPTRRIDPTDQSEVAARYDPLRRAIIVQE
mgnify:CR=1 FL=1